ncbi:MAG: hypothetical protein KKH52_03990 [Nanoarchaeota archaeon]|nr:hypothetical protein [Nanoarchaeota archaeon]MBU1623352.1 hypothetical protein [Nanoarchaeota archaeon]MBU1974530.1 hypothetical protein [Nanoarchaeota archaeon]
MTDPKDHFKEEYLNKSERDLVIKHIGTDNSFRREDIRLDMNRRLVEEIRNFNKKSSKQTNWVIGLTVALGIIAILQLILLFR